MGKRSAPNPKQIERARVIAAVLAKEYPQAKCALNFNNPLQLLIATILSAQCTDVRVNQVTPELFRRFPDAQSLAKADATELEQMIRTTGFFRMKAKAIQAACRDIAALHGGKVPRTLEELTALRGVGRKTANVVLGNAYKVPGIVVDTHVKRVSHRLGLTKNTDPEKIEQDLMKLFPPERWTGISHELIFHGRTLCKAPVPYCLRCPVEKLCPYPKKNFKK